MEEQLMEELPMEELPIKESDENTLDSNINAIPDKRLIDDVLRIIFQYLDTTDLDNTLMAFRSWSKLINDEKRIRKKRREPYCGLQILKLKSNQRFNFSEDFPNPKKKKPSIGFFFSLLSSTLTNKFDEKERMKALSSLNCNTIMLISRQIIMNEEIEETEDFPDYKRPKISLAYAFLPQISNMKIELFSLRNWLSERYEIENTVEYNEIKSRITESALNPETSTCLMFFHSNYDYSYITTKKWITTMQCRHEDEIDVLWGGQLYGITTSTHDFVPTYMSSKPEESASAVSIILLITGPIKMWCFVVENGTTKIEAKLEILKNQIEFKTYSLAFVMQPYGSSANKIFKRFFPDVHLIGCTGSFNLCKINIDPDENKNKWCNQNGTSLIPFLIFTYD